MKRSMYLPIIGVLMTLGCATAKSMPKEDVIEATARSCPSCCDAHADIWGGRAAAIQAGLSENFAQIRARDESSDHKALSRPRSPEQEQRTMWTRVYTRPRRETGRRAAYCLDHVSI